MALIYICISLVRSRLSGFLPWGLLEVLGLVLVGIWRLVN